MWCCVVDVARKSGWMDVQNQSPSCKVAGRHGCRVVWASSHAYQAWANGRRADGTDARHLQPYAEYYIGILCHRNQQPLELPLPFYILQSSWDGSAGRVGPRLIFRIPFCAPHLRRFPACLSTPRHHLQITNITEPKRRRTQDVRATGSDI